MKLDILEQMPIGRSIRLKGMRDLVQPALEERFGALDDEIIQAINQADEATLKAVNLSTTLEQVRHRLGLANGDAPCP